jgi:hypothetical protein
MQTYQAFSASAFGINPGRSASRAMAGVGLPPTSAGMSPTDSGSALLHPDSSTFWLAAVAAATVLGIFGAEFGARFGKGTAKVSVGKV